jgi:hypothetical protein
MWTNNTSFQWNKAARRLVILFSVSAVFLSGHLAAATIDYRVTGLGGDVFRYEFLPSNLDLLQNQEFDVQFSSTLFGGLLNGVAGSDFRLLLLQPGNPSGAVGHYSSLALVDAPSLVGPFSVDVEWLGAGRPRALPFVLHQFDSTGQRIIGTIGAGVLGTPEPGAWALSLTGLIFISSVLRVARRGHQ